MADTLVDGDVQNFLDGNSRGPFGPYYHDVSIGAIILTDAANDLAVRRTTDKGTNWIETTIFTGRVVRVSCWFDKETPGNTGTLLHITWMDSDADRVYYRSYDLSDGTLGTERNIQAAAATTSGLEINDITVARNGDIHIVYIVDNGDTDHLRSGDGGATWDSVTSPIEVFLDGIFLFPASTGDDADIAGLYGDTSAEAYSLKMWDNSAGTWTETAIISVTDIAISRRFWDGVIRLSDGHLMVALLTNINIATADMLAYDLTLDSIASPTITAKTNVFDNATALVTACWMNQNTGEWRVLWNSGAIGAANVGYKVSSDGGGTWGGEQTYNETADDIRMISAGRAAFSTGGRFQPAWFEDDLNDVWVNEVNDVEIAAAVVAVTRGLRKLRGVGA